jgi:hypothetical protein
MLFPIIVFLLVLSPLFIPVAVTVVHVFGNWRSRRAARPVGSPRQSRPAVGLVPAAA